MKCEVSIDWLTFSVKEAAANEVIEDWLGLNPDLFQETGLSINGYQRVKVFSNIYVMSEPRENKFFQNMGVCVSMSGNGCRTFETFSRFAGTPDKQGQESASFLTLFQRIDTDPNAHITRLDIACDEREGILDMKTIVQCVENGEINSRLKKRRVIFAKDNKKDDGCTVYIGAASSGVRFRIYDKAAEQHTDEHWVRVEMVLRGRNANGFVSELMNGQGRDTGKLAAQVMNDKLLFIELDDSNISRCTVCSWWSAFVDELESVHLVARSVIQHSVEHIAEWVRNQVTPSLYILTHTMGFEFMQDIIEEALERLTSKQEALITDWRAIQTARRNAGLPLPQTSAAV